MNCFDIARRIRIRSVRVGSKNELIAVIATVIIYFAVNLLMQKFCTKLSQKVINIISAVIAAVIAFILFLFLNTNQE